MVYKIGGSTPATVKIGGSTGIKTTAPVSYSAPKTSAPVSYSNPVSTVKSTPVVSTPKVTSSVLSPSIKATVAASNSNVSVVPKAIKVATTPILSPSVNKAVSNIINVSNQNATVVPKSITVATTPILTPSLNKTVVENVATVKQVNTVSIPNITVATTPILSPSIKTEVSNIINNVSNIVASIPKPEEKLVIQSVTPKATFDSSVPLLEGSIKSAADIAKYSERKDTDKITFSDKAISDFNKYTSQANLKSIPVKSSISKIASPISMNMQQNAVAVEHPASQAYPLYDNSVYGGEELVGPQPTSFEWTMPAGKVGPNYVDAQGNIMSKDAYVQKYNVDPDYALWYMRTGQAAKELATTGQKSAQLSTIVTPQNTIQNPISTASYQSWEHPASQAYPLVDNSVYGGEELVGPQPTSFEWTMPSGRIGPNYVDAKGDIMSKDAYIQKYNVDPEYALQYMRSNQAGKELENTISGRPYQDLSTIG
jgi:hypothetical protein